jgi:outer membrane protein
MIKFVRCAAAAFMLGASVAAASAADLAPPPPAPAPALPDAFQPFQVRLRAVGVITSSGGILQTVPGGTFVSGGFKTSDSVIPELDVSYFLTKNIALEAVCCVSYNKVYLSGGTIAPNQQAASTWLFPPTVLVQYHWTDFGHFQPYVGVGVNYTVYFHQHAAEPLLNTVGIQSSWGVAGQIGFDYMIDDHWGFNFDVKKILMNPHVYGTVAAPSVTPYPGSVSISGQANISPWLIGAGITYRFGGPAPAAVVAKY